MDPSVKTERQSSPSQALPPRSPDPPDLEISFDRDFRCCGLVLPSFPELLQHYQENVLKSPDPKHYNSLPAILRAETRREDGVSKQGNWKLENALNAVHGILEGHSAETGPTASPRQQIPERRSRLQAVREDAEEGDIPDCLNAIGLSESPRTYGRSNARLSESHFGTSPSSYRPSTAGSSTRRSLSTSDNELEAFQERAWAESSIMLSDDNDEVTFLSSQAKEPHKAAETRASPSRGSTRPFTTGPDRLGKKRSLDDNQEEGITENLPTATTKRRSAPRKKKRTEPGNARNAAASDTKYSVASLPPGSLSGDPYINVKIAALHARLPAMERGALTGVSGVRPVAVTAWDRISLDITHPQKLKALAIQVAGRTAPEACTRCSMSGPNKRELIFPTCMVRKGTVGPCSECLFRHHTHECSLNPMRREDPMTARAHPSGNAMMKGPTGKRRGTRGSVRNREDDSLMDGKELPAQRGPNKK